MLPSSSSLRKFIHWTMDSSISTIDINIEDLQSKPNELNASIISNDIVDMNDQLNDIINNQDTNSLLPAHETNCIINNEIDKQSSSNSKVYDMDQVHLYNFIVIHQFNQPYSYIYQNKFKISSFEILVKSGVSNPWNIYKWNHDQDA